MTPADEPALDLPGLVRDRVAEGRAKAAATRARKVAEAEIASELPVARVLLELPMAHLDRTFDYAVPVAMAEGAQAGTRVKVRFAGQDVDGFVVARLAESDHPGALAPLRRLVSAEPVLSPQVLAVVERVAQRYAGTRADLLRLAVPPRHASVEKEAPAEPWEQAVLPPAQARSAWEPVDGGPGFLEALAAGGSPRAAWSAGPGRSGAEQLVGAIGATLASGRGALVVLPDLRDVSRLEELLLARGLRAAVLTAQGGPAQRYRDFLRVARGEAQLVIGTRSAAFAPVRDLGLAVLWDEGDELHAEPRAPYPHVREILLARAEVEGCALLLGGHARSTDLQLLVRTGVLQDLRPVRDALRAAVTVGIAGATDKDLERDPFARSSRVPQQAFQLIRSALETGPVLVQNPRVGYLASLACEHCRTPARCTTCTGPLRLGGPTRPPTCGWCGTTDESWACGECGHRGLRAPVVGEARTAEELGRAFPGARVVTSAGDQVRESVPDKAHTIVVATPGAEPGAGEGYAAVVLLDTWLMVTRDGLRVREEALRRWMNAAALTRHGGQVIAVGDPADPTLQALVRWDPAGHAERELADRASAHLQPACRLATITGEAGAVDDALTLLAAPASTEVLGPMEHGEDGWRAVVRTPHGDGAALVAALGELQRLRSARKLTPVRIQVDPLDL